MSNKRAQNNAAPENQSRAAVDPAPAPADPPAKTGSEPSTQPETQAKNGTEAASKNGVKAMLAGDLVINGEPASTDVRNLVDKLLIEGSTFEDVAEAANASGAPELTLSVVRSYFQGSPKLQARRVRYLVETSESLLEGLGGDPDSAEARLAKAAFLTGYLNLHEDVAPVAPKDAEHVRMERANLALKQKLVVSQRDKARQALKFMEERVRLLVLTQQRVKQEMETLQRDANRRQAGEPLEPEMLQKIQQIYGLTSQPMLGEGKANGAAKA